MHAESMSDIHEPLSGNVPPAQSAALEPINPDGRPKLKEPLGFIETATGIMVAVGLRIVQKLYSALPDFFTTHFDAASWADA